MPTTQMPRSWLMWRAVHTVMHALHCLVAHRDEHDVCNAAISSTSLINIINLAHSVHACVRPDAG